MTSLTRRQLLTFGLGATAAGALAACATPGTTSVNAAPTIPPEPSGHPVRLTYWAWLKDLQKVADIWNAQNPHIQVETVWIPGGNEGGYQKLYSALAAGGGPDLAQVELRAVPEFMLVNGLVDLSRYGADAAAPTFDPTLWNQVSFTGGVYGIPQDSGPMATFYQTELFEKIGARPPDTWSQWAEVAAEFRTAGAYIDVFPIADPSSFVAYATQAGATWLTPTDDGWVIDMTGEATLTVARFFDHAIDSDLVTTDYGLYSPPWFAAAAAGGLASLTDASWADALLEGVSGAEGKWRVAPMPRWEHGGFGSSFRGGSTTTVLAHSAHPAEALEFATWLNGSRAGIDGLIEHCGIGWSANPDYIGASRMQPSPFFGGQDYNTDVFLPASTEQNPDWSWWPITQQSLNILADEFRRKPSGQSLVDAVANAERQIISAFENKGLSIRKETA
ncbi:extracellular solute-binding protein [Pseudactinotalea sp. HY158]|uniref:extracellular solute-binding protein n=1 Tax=Pseudactinotalea sp. HY158 TaxID=2654547 RepID=UPI00129CF850|nr:extracellular solute-binding protein [Pseudactinotalea sp. HY158]QGH68119.1 extracellular solute-binding protein [Pseudactinotalea sp. HY158]